MSSLSFDLPGQLSVRPFVRIARCYCVIWIGLIVLALASAAAEDDRYAVKWDQVATETAGHFDALLRIDTSNPPGNETVAAEYLKKVLEGEGIAAKLLCWSPIEPIWSASAATGPSVRSW